MNRLNLIVIFVFVCLSGRCQTHKEKKDEISRAFKEWANNPVLTNQQLDLNIIHDLKDSGSIVNQLKKGYWVEYSIDTTSAGREIELHVGDQKRIVTLTANLQKETGNYVNGKREGIWTQYTSRQDKAPFYWTRYSVANYRSGLKNGEEVFYQVLGQTLLIERQWNNNIETSGKIYNVNYPYKLKQEYIVVGGKQWLRKEYYADGLLKTELSDTVLAGQKLRYMQEFFQNRNPKATGYFLGATPTGTWIYFYDDGKPKSITYYNARGEVDGSYKVFHRNGRLWTERIYEANRLIKVVSSYDQDGNAKDVGTIKDGNGLLYDYDKDGKLKERIEYINGYEKPAGK